MQRYETCIPNDAFEEIYERIGQVPSMVALIMSNIQNSQYRSYVKRAWAMYVLITIALIVVLVLFVARDDEERFFFTIMPAAAAYVFRPTERYLSKLIFKFTGVSKPTENE
jgi:hypothetical protein